MAPTVGLIWASPTRTRRMASILNHAPRPQGHVEPDEDERATDHREGGERLPQPPDAEERSHDRLDIDEERYPRRLHSLEHPVPHQVTEGGDHHSEVGGAEH